MEVELTNSTNDERQELIDYLESKCWGWKMKAVPYEEVG
jgi:hypothetical protein